MRAGLLSCEAQRPTGGEGRPGDYYIENHWFQAVFRQETDAATLPGAGGGTLVDAAPHGVTEGIAEVIPIVGGGWLREVDVALDGARLCVTGTVLSLPGFPPASAAGSTRTACWEASPDAPRLSAVGAEGLWLHPEGSAALRPRGLEQGSSWIGWEGSALDQGGAVTVSGDALILSQPGEVWPWLTGDRVQAAISAPGAASLTLAGGGEVLARIPMDEDYFEGEIPAEVDEVWATAPGFAPSPARRPTPELALSLGGEGSLVLAKSPLGRPYTLTWARLDGLQEGRLYLGPESHTLALGAGAYALRLEGGPGVTPQSHLVTLGPARTPLISASLADPLAEMALLTLGAPVDRAKTWRGTDAGALGRLAARGVRFAVLTPEDDVAPAAIESEWGAWVSVRPGARLHGAGWKIEAWPWAESSKRGAHGAERVLHLSPEDALALAWGGPGRDRHTVVDLPWLMALSPPLWSIYPAPEFVRLGHPDASDWAPWYHSLDARLDLRPVGPYARVARAPDAGAVALERALLWEPMAAGTGAWIAIHPLPSPPAQISRWIEVELRGAGLHTAEVIGEGGEVIARWEVQEDAELHRVLLPPTAWAIARAWGDEAWTVTRPTWYESP